MQIKCLPAQLCSTQQTSQLQLCWELFQISPQFAPKMLNRLQCTQDMHSMFFVSILSGYIQHANSVSLATLSTHWNESGSQAMTGYVILYLHTFLFSFFFFSATISQRLQKEKLYLGVAVYGQLCTRCLQASLLVGNGSDLSELP